MTTRRTVLRAGGLVAAGSALAVTGASPAGAALATVYQPPPARQRIDLNSGWRFTRSDVAGAQATAFDDSGWTAVTVPHTWNATDGQDGGNNYYRGVGWYRRHYTPPASLSGKKLWLQFAGANQVADVYLNGVSLGQHKGGYARFRFDASALKIGQDNVIAVRVTNANDASIPPLSADYTFFGGIYRNVSLQVTDPLSVRLLDFAGPGIYLRQRSVSASSATIDVTTKVWNNATATRSVAVRTVVTDAANIIVADVISPARSTAAATGFDLVQTVTIANPHRWQGKADPYLYTVNVELHDAAAGTVTDFVTDRLGVRAFTVDATSGFLLNGQHVALHGVNRHQDRLGRGWAIGDTEHTQDFDLMDEMGVNALRTAHYQQDQKVYNLADERGYVVWAEIPLVNSVTNSTAFTANAQQMLHELITQNYNHPAICFWGIGNEQGSDDSATNTLLASLASIVSSSDPERLSTYAHNGGITSGLVNHSAVNGYNHYAGWYSGTMTEFASFVDNLHSTQPTRRIAISEYGAGASIIQHQENPPEPVASSHFHPEEYQALLHESHWSQIKTRPFLWGTFVWNMFDFAADARAEGDTNGRNDKGLVTYDRLTRKDAFWWYKANWTTTPFVYVTGRHWTSRTAAATTVKVYATTDTVALTLNGSSLGAPKTSTNHIFSWSVTLAHGTNIVVATGVLGGSTYTDTVTWTLP